jgi:hypothetical protein
LRQPDEALVALGRIDSSEARVNHPGFVVRSWAERGALHQQLGHKDEAARWYQQFIAARQHADTYLQPDVDRAKQALAALRGETPRNAGDRP